MTSLIKEIKNKFERLGIQTFEEATKGNYNRNIELIETDIPTLTTEYCEIGFYRNEIYLVFIIESDSWNENLYDILKNIPNKELYGLYNFHNNYNFDNIEVEIKKELYFQLQLNLNTDEYKVEDFVDFYKEIVHKLTGCKIKIANQLKNDMRNLSKFYGDH